MILGIGIDLIEHDRIKKLSNIETFVKKHFTVNEQEFFKSKSKERYYVTVANSFAVKEAFSKAMGTGVRFFSLNEIEVLRDDLGKPYVKLYGNAKKVFEQTGGKSIFVSITDTAVYSSAVVVAEG